ncbi:MAG: tetratricopeptide repeat protein [Pseudomonadota bacterium]
MIIRIPISVATICALLWLWLPGASAAITQSEPGDRDAPRCNQDIVGTIQKNAEAGDAEAQFVIAQLLASGHCMPLSMGDALNWLERAAKAGHLEAAYQLSVHFVTEKDEESRAIPFLRTAAQAGHSQAQHLLGLILLGPDAAPEQQQQGLYWLGSAASEDSGFSALVLGQLHERGMLGVPRNVCLALDWYEASHLTGSPDAAGYSKRLLSKIDREC